MKKAFTRFDLTNKTALITGAAGLLGYQHSAALLESGASVILTDINESQLHATRKQLAKTFDSQKILIEIMDVSNPKKILMVFNSIKERDGRVDILINNAAIDPKMQENDNSRELSRFENFDLDQWDLQIRVGLTGAFLCSQIFGNAMIEDGKGGVILNISSDLSVFSPDQRLYKIKGLKEEMQPVKPVTYSVIKTGLIGLTRYISTYWADKNVRCNALSPGGVFNNHNKDFVERLVSLIPLGRMANPEEYRAAVQFLCSDASSYMNGQNIVIDGGRSIW